MNIKLNIVIVSIIMSMFSHWDADAQYRRPDEKIYIDFGAGSTNAVEPYTPGYRSPTFGFIHAHAGFRLHMNDYFGYRLWLGYDQIKNAEGGRSLPFKTTYFRGSAEAIVDLGEALRFNDFTTVFGLFLHGGVGYGQLIGNRKSASTLHFINGPTLTLYLSKRFNLTYDLTRVNNVYQQITFDMLNTHNEKGFDGMIFNMSLGVSVLLSKIR